MIRLTKASQKLRTYESLRPIWRISQLPETGLTNNNLFHVRFRSTTTETMPKIAQASIWTSIIPRFLRSREPRISPSSQSSTRDWNPATFYIVIFTLIGSQAIQMLVLRKDYENYTRRAEAKLRLLSEVIQRVKNGESVDVERILGTGDETKEREWEEVLKEIEDEDSLWRQKSVNQRKSHFSEPTDEMDKSPVNTPTEKRPVKTAEEALPNIPAPKDSPVDGTVRSFRFY